MKRTYWLAAISLALLAAPAAAQGIQNMDISILFGATATPGTTIAGTDTTLSGGTSWTGNTAYGYQVARLSAVSLWLDVSLGFAGGGGRTALPSGSLSLGWHEYTPGLRLMAPIQSRVSAYGVIGYGAGNFRRPYVFGGDAPSVTTDLTWRGVFEAGGGLDIRLSRFFSIRAEVRDFMSGRGLSGAAGRHHWLPSAGIAFHN